MKQKFNVTGMTCSSCQAHVEKSVAKLHGVDEVTVNLLSNNMNVSFDETQTNTDQIIAAVESAGYGASVYTKGKTTEKPKDTVQDEMKEMKSRLIISFIFLIPLMYISMHHMFNEWFGLPVPAFVKALIHGDENAVTYALSQFLLLLPILFVNQKYFRVGFHTLRKGAPNMDTLIAIGATAATVYGLFAIFRIGYGLGHGDFDLVSKYTMDIYFESAGTILTLITLGKYLETRSKGKTSEAITKLMNLAPKTAVVIRNDKEIEIEIENVVVGDIVVVKPGQNVPVDGIVIEGSTSVDQAALTGESIPVEKGVGDNVIAATVNKTGYFKMKATKVGDDTTLAQIIQLVEDASNSKAPIAKMADKISGIFVPIVISIAILAAVIWLLVGASFEFALSIGIAVLVISCPCALGLATPVAIMVGTGKGAENGILIKSAESLETAHTIQTVVLDKTGTITEGKPKVTDI
ncbi:MAG: heavy metal translocating P-type ATPase, partial [Lachnospiraceae bacterium]